MRFRDYKLALSGLYHCCVDTYNRLAVENKEVAFGDRFNCDYCSSVIELSADHQHWRWWGIEPRAPKGPPTPRWGGGGVVAGSGG